MRRIKLVLALATVSVLLATAVPQVLRGDQVGDDGEWACFGQVGMGDCIKNWIHNCYCP